jgi:hypothetical protein
MIRLEIDEDINSRANRNVLQISAVVAKWCPHCYPLSVDKSMKLSEKLRVPCRILDIDIEGEGILADDLVRKHGDECEDYLIPQIFLEFGDGSVHTFSRDLQRIRK